MMGTVKRGAAWIAGWLMCSAACAQAAPPAQHLSIVGGLSGVAQYVRHEEPFWTRNLSQWTQGRVTAEIVPFDRAGIRGQEILRLVQLGAVPFGTAMLSVSAAQDPELSAPDLAGLNPDMASLRRTVEAFRPVLTRLLRERYGAELLALYPYPAQVTFCARALPGLAGLAGRRVRVANGSQADFVAALGAVPMRATLAEIAPGLRSGEIDCAIAGAMFGSSLDLRGGMASLLPLPLGWGVAAFVANGPAWVALPPDLRGLLQRELPKLEAALWAESEQGTQAGIACDIGSADCHAGRAGHMALRPMSEADDALRRELLVSHVLPLWFERCGPGCAKLWQDTLGPALGIDAR
jgi:TRAP-type C4-dicarboxylate transport system substrate-binding protein